MKRKLVEDYLKAIYRLQHEQNPVTTTALAKWLRVVPASVTRVVQKLAEMELVVYQPYRGTRLTKSGREKALKIHHNYRLIVLYFRDALGLTSEQAHAEAEKWEHLLSEEVGERMQARLDEMISAPP